MSTHAHLGSTLTPEGDIIIATSGLAIANLINDPDFDLEAGAYSNSAVVPQDSRLGTLSLHFTTTEERSITVALDDGTVVYKWEPGDGYAASTALDVAVPLTDERFDSGQGVSIDITQTAGPCLVDVRVTYEYGTTELLGDNPEVVILPGNTATRSSVPHSTSAVTLLTAEPSRIFAEVNNNTDARMYVALGLGATITDYTFDLNPGGHRRIDGWAGALSAVWDSAPGGVALVTEVTP